MKPKHTLIVALLVAVLCSTQCSFHPAWQPTTTLPIPLKHLQLKTPSPYSRFTETMRDTLTTYGFTTPSKLTEIYTCPAVTLHILKATIQKHSNTLTPKRDARELTLQAHLVFTLEDNQHKRLIPIQHFNSQRQCVLLSGQPLQYSATWRLQSQTLRQDLAERMVFFLYSPQVIQAVHSVICHED